jgi:hypothetical protein
VLLYLRDLSLVITPSGGTMSLVLPETPVSCSPEGEIEYPSGRDSLSKSDSLNRLGDWSENDSIWERISSDPDHTTTPSFSSSPYPSSLTSQSQGSSSGSSFRWDRRNYDSNTGDTGSEGGSQDLNNRWTDYRCSRWDYSGTGPPTCGPPTRGPPARDPAQDISSSGEDHNSEESPQPIRPRRRNEPQGRDARFRLRLAHEW